MIFIYCKTHWLELLRLKRHLLKYNYVEATKSAYQASMDFQPHFERSSIPKRLQIGLLQVLYHYYLEEEFIPLYSSRALGKRAVFIKPGFRSMTRWGKAVSVPILSRFSLFRMCFIMIWCLVFRQRIKQRYDSFIACHILVEYNNNPRLLSMAETLFAGLDGVYYLNHVMPYIVFGIHRQYMSELCRTLKSVHIPGGIKLHIGLIFLSYINILFKTEPGKMVSMNEFSYKSGIIAYAAEVMHVITYNVAHSVTFGYEKAHNPYDYYFVFGQKSIDNFFSMQGLSMSNPIAGGSVKDDILFRHVSKIPGSNQGDDTLFRILLLSTYFLKNDERNKFDHYKKLHGIIRQNPNIHWTIKMHPEMLKMNDRGLGVEEQVFSNSENVDLVREGDNFHLISESHLVISYEHSTAGLDALILKKPIILLRLDGYNYRDAIGYQDTNYVMFCENIDRLHECIWAMELRIRHNQLDLAALKTYLGKHFSRQGEAAHFITGSILK